MNIACLDFEGVLIPEIWINVAEITGIEKLKLTTRDIQDYDELMKIRLDILEANNINLSDIQAVIGKMEPLPGAIDFLTWLQEQYQVMILSDTFYEFAMPLLEKFGYPSMLCHNLKVSSEDKIIGYQLRQLDSKREAVKAFHGLNFNVIAVGDSYNDTSMLAEADIGILFNPPKNVVDDFPQFEVITDYSTLKDIFLGAKSIL